LIQGRILFQLPAHFDVAAQPLGFETEETERIAEDEAELLGLGVGAGNALFDAMDERGIKVFRRTRGPEGPEHLTGGFHYEGEAGPALLVGAADNDPDAAFVLAHEYGHLVMDVNPYVSRFCRWNRASLENQSDSILEDRADRFARALLIPSTQMLLFAHDLTLDRGPEDESALGRAAVFFQASPALVWHRMGDLELERRGVPPRPIPLGKVGEVDERRPTDLPERFVNLALAAFGQRFLEKSDLTRFLRIPPEQVERFLSWCPIPRVPRPLVEEDGLTEAGLLGEGWDEEASGEPGEDERG
jgi:Zn-dependent peptidase ImmA (M78 family)